MTQASIYRKSHCPVTISASQRDQEECTEEGEAEGEGKGRRRKRQEKEEEEGKGSGRIETLCDICP